MTTYLQQHGDDIWLFVHVQPGAKNTAWAGEYGERIKIRLHAPPIDGRANAALCDWLATQFDCAARTVSVLKGNTSRTKTICFKNLASQHDSFKIKLMQALQAT